MFSRVCIIASLFALGACAGAEADPPSLAARPIEGIIDEPMRGIAPVASAEDPALAARISELVTQAERGENAFNSSLPRARSAVAGAGGLESESWINAQMAVSALASTRSKTTGALGELDGILAEQAASGDPAETETLMAARERVSSLYESQAQSYEALVAALRSR